MNIFNVQLYIVSKSIFHTCSVNICHVLAGEECEILVLCVAGCVYSNSGVQYCIG